MLTNSELLKKATIDYSFFCVLINLHCPFCAHDRKRVKTYHSLKSLQWHVVHNHKAENGYPFNLEQIQEILKIIAKAIEWRVLP